MALQNRRGIFEKFDPTRLLPGEYAIVLSGDTVAKDGKAVYICFAAGDVKRLATYEDMHDYLLDNTADTLEYIETTATEDVRETYTILTNSLTLAENMRVSAEEERVANENTRKANELQRVSNEQGRQSAETQREGVINDLENKVTNGYFNGATFYPSVNENGVLSWTNDKSLDNPASINIKGEKGNDGVVTQLAAGMFALAIEGTDLILTYGDNATVPDLSIKNDCLMLNVED